MKASSIAAMAVFISSTALGLDETGLDKAGLEEAGLVEVWHYDMPCAAASVPLVADYNNDGISNVVIPSPQDVSIWILHPDGTEVHHISGLFDVTGSASSDGVPGHFAVEGCNGRVTVFDYRVQGVFGVETGVKPVPGFGPCISDLDGDSIPEVLCTRPNGLLYVFDGTLAPRWQFDAGDRLNPAIAVAPVFAESAGIYVVAADGSLCAVAGDGQPLWRFVPDTRRAQQPGQDGPLVVQFPNLRAGVLYSGVQGWLHAVDAGNGEEQWRARVSDVELGSPAIADIVPGGSPEIIVVSRQGEVAVLDGEGHTVLHNALPKGQYVPRPLVADVDADGQMEILVATLAWTLLVITPSGELEQTLKLRGNASEGCVLADLNTDGYLELLAATDCARVHCFKTRAKSGWTHPRGGYGCNGCVGTISPLPLPAPPGDARSARIEMLSLRDYIERSPFASAFVIPRLYRDTQYLAATIRKEDRIVGSAWKSITADGTTVPFIQEGSQSATLDISLYRDKEDLIATTAGIPLRPATVKLVDIPPVDGFLSELAQLGKRRKEAMPPPLPIVAGRTEWHVCDLSPQEWALYDLAPDPFISEAIPYAWQGLSDPPPVDRDTFAVLGDNDCCASLSIALARGAARQRGTVGPAGTGAWGVSISDAFCNATTNMRFVADAPGVRWNPPHRAEGQDCGHSASLQSRLFTAAHLAGVTYVRHESNKRNGTVFAQEKQPGQFSVSPVGAAAKAWHDLANANAERGVPYTPFAFMLEEGHRWHHAEDFCREGLTSIADRSTMAVFSQVFDWQGHTDQEKGFLTDGPYGDVFDVVTEDAAVTFLMKYGVVWLLGDIVFDEAQTRRLMRYVDKGGILVLDAARAAAFPIAFTGVTFSGEQAAATQVQTALGPTGPVKAPVRYRVITPSGKTETLAWTDSGNPLLTWRKVDEGIVMVSATTHWIDERGALIPIVPALMKTLADAFVPVDVSCDVQLLVNRTPRGWLVGLINNYGVTKTPTTPVTVDETQFADCLVYFKEGVPLRFTARLGEFNWSNKANGLQTRVNPGEVAIVEAIFGL